MPSFFKTPLWDWLWYVLDPVEVKMMEATRFTCEPWAWMELTQMRLTAKLWQRRYYLRYQAHLAWDYWVDTEIERQWWDELAVMDRKWREQNPRLYWFQQDPSPMEMQAAQVDLVDVQSEVMLAALLRRREELKREEYPS